MQIAVVYASRTGNTQRAASLVAAACEQRGHDVAIMSVDDLHFKALAEADLIIFGTWVAGHFVIGQKPGDAARLARVPKLTGKQVAVFLTYALNPGNALGKFAAALEREGAQVIGGYAWNRSKLPAGVDEFADAVLEAAQSPATTA